MVWGFGAKAADAAETAVPPVIESEGTPPPSGKQTFIMPPGATDKLPEDPKIAQANFTMPSKEVAQAAREAAHPRDNEGKKYNLFTSERNIGERFGPGVCLYFKNLWWMAVLFIIVFILHIPQVIVTHNANTHTPGYDTQAADESESWSFTETWSVGFTLGGLANNDLPGQLVFLGDYIVMWGNELVEKNKALYMIAALDLASMLIIVLTCAWLYGRTREISEQIDGNTVSIDDYSLELTGLPDDATEADIRAFVSKTTGADPHDVVIVRKVGEVLDDINKRGKQMAAKREIEAQLVLDEKLKPKNRTKLEKQVATMQQGIDKVEQKMAAGVEKGLDGAEVVGAFVTFNTEEERANGLFALNQPTALFQDQHDVRANRARPPEDYKYESLSFTKAEKTKRKIKTWFIVAGIMALAAGAYIGLRLGQQAMINEIDWDEQAMVDYVKSAIDNGNLEGVEQGAEWTGSPKRACTATLDVCATKLSSPVVEVTLDYGEIITMVDKRTGKAPSGAYTTVVLNALKACSIPENLTDAKAQASTDADCDANANNPCLVCYCQGLSTQSWNGNAAKSVREQCAVFITDAKYVSGFAFGTSLVTAVTNVMIQLVMRRLVEYAKYDTTSRAERAIFLKIALLQLINTIVVPVLAQAYFDGFSYASNSLFSGGYPDYIQSWYSGVGAPMVLTILMQVVIQMIIKAIGYWTARSARKKPYYTQEAMNAAFVGKSFTLADKYAKTAFYTGVAITYGLGMPMLFLAAIIAFAVDSLVERHRLLRLNAKPPRFDMDLELGFLRLVGLFVLIHLAIAMWMMSYFRTPYVGGDDAWDTSANTPSSGLTLSSILNSTANRVDALVDTPKGLDQPAVNLTATQKQQVDAWISGVNQATLEDTLNQYGDKEVWATSSSFYNNGEGRYNPARIFQIAPFIFTVPFLLLCLHVLLDFILGEKYQRFLRKYLFCCSSAWSTADAHGHPPLNKAIEDNSLRGPASYRLADDPRYKTLFTDVEEGHTDEGSAIKKMLDSAVAKHGSGSVALTGGTAAAAAAGLQMPTVDQIMTEAEQALPGSVDVAIS